MYKSNSEYIKEKELIIFTCNIYIQHFSDHRLQSFYFLFVFFFYLIADKINQIKKLGTLALV